MGGLILFSISCTSDDIYLGSCKNRLVCVEGYGEPDRGDSFLSKKYQQTTFKNNCERGISEDGGTFKAQFSTEKCSGKHIGTCYYPATDSEERLFMDDGLEITNQKPLQDSCIKESGTWIPY